MTTEIKQAVQKKYFTLSTTTTLNKIMETADAEIPKLLEEIDRSGFTITGPMEFIYFGATAEKDKAFSLDIAVPVSDTSKKPERYHFKEYGQFKCISYMHKGDFTNIHDVYEQLFAELAQKGLRPTDQVREVYHQWKDARSEENLVEIQIGLN